MLGRLWTAILPVSGGLGLKLLSEFIDLKAAAFRLCQMQAINRKTVTALLNHPFTDTVVNLEINIADTQSHKLAVELVESDIF